MEELRNIMGAAIVAIAILLHVATRVFRLGDRAQSLIWVVVALQIALWVPAGVRDWTLALLVAFVVLVSWGGDLATNGLASVVTGGVVLLLGQIPGGTSALILLAVGIIGFFQIRSGLRHTRRLARAAHLIPGELPTEEVMVGGRVPDEKGTVSPPLDHDLETVWWSVVVDDQHRASSGRLRIDSEAGTVLADLDRSQLALSGTRQALCKIEDRAALEALCERARAAAEERAVWPQKQKDAEDTGFEDTSHYSFYWLQPGDEVVLMGTPEWERAPADMAGYRDAPLVPLFRGAKVFMTDKSATKTWQDARFNVIAWSVWGPVCGVISVLQLSSLL